MRLENSFQAEQADETLLPKSASADSVTDTWPHTDLEAMNAIVLHSGSHYASCNKPVDMDLSLVCDSKPQADDATVL